MAKISSFLFWLAASASASEYHVTVPHVRFEGERTTRLILIHPGPWIGTTSWCAFSKTGEELGEGDLNRNGASRVILDLSDFLDTSVLPSVGWLDVVSDAEVLVLAEEVRPNSRAAFWASRRQFGALDVPHVARDQNLFETTIGVVNTSDISVDVTLFGEPLGNATSQLSVSPFSSVDLRAAEVFPQGDETDWARLVGSASGLAGMEKFTTLPERDRTATLDLGFSRTDHLVFIHVAEDVDQFWTGLVLVNTGESVLPVDLVYYNASGAVLLQETRTMEAKAKHTILFDEIHREPVGTAWLDVRAARPNLVGYELFGSAHDSTHRFFAGLSACSSPGYQLVFPVVASSQDLWTGFVVVNLGSDPSDLSFELHDDSGAVLVERVITVNPGEKIVATVADVFGDTASASGTWLRAVGSGNHFVGAALWGDRSEPRQVLSGVIAHSLARGNLLMDREFEWDGLTRTFNFYEPDSLPPSHPVLFVLHGGGINADAAATQLNTVEWLDVADEDGLLVIFPDGVHATGAYPTMLSWNDGRADNATVSTADDVGFIDALLNWALAKYSGIDTNRVYAVGASNGGMMALRLAQELNHRIAAVGLNVAYKPAIDEAPDPSGPFSAIMFAGDADPQMPWDGGYVGGRVSAGTVLSAVETRDYLIGINNCQNTPVGAGRWHFRTQAGQWGAGSNGFKSPRQAGGGTSQSVSVLNPV